MKLRESLRWIVALSVVGNFVACTDEAPDGATTERQAAATAPYDWLQFNGDAARTGNNTREGTLAAANVAQLVRKFQVTLPAIADGAPVIMTGVLAGGVTRALLFVTTKPGHLVALDAQTGATVWSVQHGPGTCHINNGTSACYTTASPAIDPGRQFVYSYGLDGRVHKHAVATGAETTTGGWPQLTTTKGFDEKSASALVFATARSGSTFLYVSHGGYPGDRGDYQGHLTVIDLATGAQRVFNAECS